MRAFLSRRLAELFFLLLVGAVYAFLMAIACGGYAPCELVR